jgi:fatty acid desaturase
MADRAIPSSSFSLTQARHLVKDLFTPNPAIYWADFLLSSIAGGVLFVLVRRVFPLFSIQQIVAFFACAICFYRAVLFTHELVHLRDKTFRAFRITWNLMCGIPFLMPSFMYYTHVDHHMRKYFATEHDGEYISLATGSPWRILVYLCQPFVLPVIAVVRFLILAPISWVSPAFRDFVHQRASSMVMDPTYIRPLPTKKTLRIFRLQEVLCFLWAAGVATVLSLGIIPIGFLITAYLISVTILMFNAFRTLGAHRYTNPGVEATFLEQILDTVNYPNHPLVSEIWGPVGLRYHALHHVFPSMPYHNLAKAHARLMAALPADSPYRLTTSPSLTAAIVRLWRTAREASRAHDRYEDTSHHQLTGAGKTLTGAH